MMSGGYSYGPKVVYLGDKRYVLTREQWSQLHPLLKGMTAKEQARIAQAYMIGAGIVKDGISGD